MNKKIPAFMVFSILALCIVINCAGGQSGMNFGPRVVWKNNEFDNSMCSIMTLTTDEQMRYHRDSDIGLLFEWPFGDFGFLINNISDPDGIYLAVPYNGHKDLYKVIKLEADNNEVFIENVKLDKYVQIIACDNSSIYYSKVVDNAAIAIIKSDGRNESIVFRYATDDLNKFPPHILMSDDGKFVFAMYNLDKNSCIYYSGSNNIQYVDTGSFPFWLSDNEIGYVKDGRLVQYNIDSGKAVSIKTIDNKEISVMAEKNGTVEISISPNKEYIGYTVLNNKKLLGFITIDSPQKKLIITSMKTGESSVISINNYFFDNMKIR